MKAPVFDFPTSRTSSKRFEANAKNKGNFSFLFEVPSKRLKEGKSQTLGSIYFRKMFEENGWHVTHT